MPEVPSRFRMSDPSIDYNRINPAKPIQSYDPDFAASTPLQPNQVPDTAADIKKYNSKIKPASDTDLGALINSGLGLINSRLQAPNSKPPVLRPLAYNPKPYGTGSQAIYKDGGTLPTDPPTKNKLNRELQRAASMFTGQAFNIPESTGVKKVNPITVAPAGALPVYKNKKQTEDLKKMSERRSGKHTKREEAMLAPARFRVIMEDEDENDALLRAISSPETIKYGKIRRNKNLQELMKDSAIAAKAPLNIDTAMYNANFKMLKDANFPDINYQPSFGQRSFYRPKKDEMTLYESDDLLAEVAHAMQPKGIRFNMRYAIDELRSGFDSDKNYDIPGTLEYEAHKIIEPQLRKKRDSLYKDQIYQDNKRRSVLDKKKNGGTPKAEDGMTMGEMPMVDAPMDGPGDGLKALDRMIRMYQNTMNQYDDYIYSAKRYSPDQYNDSLVLSSGKFNTAKVPKAMINDAVKAAKRHGVDPYDLLGLIGQESTFGIGYAQKGGRRGGNKSVEERRHELSQMDMVSGWNLVQPVKDYKMFLADKKAPGVKVKKTNHGWFAQIEDEGALTRYLDDNAHLAQEYEKSMNQQRFKGMPDYFDLAAQHIKKKGFKGYNPGDPDYPNKVKASKSLLKADKTLNSYVSGLKLEHGGSLPTYYEPGKQYDLSPQQIKDLLQQGYELDFD